MATTNYSVAANSGTSSRTGTLTVAGQTFTVSQQGISQYTLTINKTGTGSGTVTTSPHRNNLYSRDPGDAYRDSGCGRHFWLDGPAGVPGISNCSLTMNSEFCNGHFQPDNLILPSYAALGRMDLFLPPGMVTINYGAQARLSPLPRHGIQAQRCPWWMESPSGR